MIDGLILFFIKCRRVIMFAKSDLLVSKFHFQEVHCGFWEPCLFANIVQYLIFITVESVLQKTQIKQAIAMTTVRTPKDFSKKNV